MPSEQQLPNDAIAEEILRRGIVQTSFRQWLSVAAPELVLAKHHSYLVERLEAVEDGRIKRLAIFMPPGSAKSTYASVHFPPHYVGRHPARCIITASYAQKLSHRFGRKCRNIVATPLWEKVFETALSRDTSARDEWETEAGAEFVATSVDGSVTGRRADIIVIDDPIKGRQEADSVTIRDTLWAWYISDVRTRLKPGGAIVLIQCMTGDTPVLMADCTEKPLRDIRPGDRVATYENGQLAVSTVRNWANHGPDRIFTIKMGSGITVRANARHPFLVDAAGGLEWRRTDTLKPGDKILRVIGESGAASIAPSRDAAARPRAAGCACPTTTAGAGQMEPDRRRSILGRVAQRACGIVTGLVSRSMRLSSRSSMASAPSASGPRETMCAPTGAASSASTIAPIAATSGGCSATTATLPSAMGKPRRCSAPPLTTFAITRDTVAAVSESGCEDVFDIQVDRTENFIANGLVSHNTRWHEDDLAGRIFQADYDGRSGKVVARDGETWEVVCIRAEAEADDPLGRRPGEMLWPEWFLPGMLAQEKVSQGPRNWHALYQQRPAPEEGDYFKRDWLMYFDKAPERSTLKVYGASDFAVTSDGGDYTVHIIAGVDPEDRVFILDLWRAQTSSDVWIERMLDMVDHWRPLMWAVEKGQIEKSVGPFLAKRMRERKSYVGLDGHPSVTDKAIRAQSIRGRVAQHMVYFPKGKLDYRGARAVGEGVWVHGLIAEMLTFPTGVHDDQVDALGLIGRMLDKMARGTIPKEREPLRGASEMTMEEAWDLLLKPGRGR